jgi:hypothetical protein
MLTKKYRLIRFGVKEKNPNITIKIFLKPNSWQLVILKTHSLPKDLAHCTSNIFQVRFLKLQLYNN